MTLPAARPRARGRRHLVCRTLRGLISGLDPHLQDLIWRARRDVPAKGGSGVPKQNRSARIDVLARLRDPNVTVHGLTVIRHYGLILTGRIALRDIQRIRRHTNVLSLKCARTLRCTLDRSVSDARLSTADLGVALPGIPLDGAGVVVGVVDSDCNFRHPNFRDPAGKTRLLALWDQNGGVAPNSPAGYDYGREFDSAAIDAALASPDPFHALGYAPGREGHGTHVLDICAGNGSGTGSPGVAPRADLVFVELSRGQGPSRDLGSDLHLIHALDYVFSLARRLGKPAVVNVSLSSHGGPHDGGTLVEAAIDHMLTSPGRAIVIAAGNTGQLRNHAAGRVAAGSARTLGWKIPLSDTSENEVEIWYTPHTPLIVSLISPGGSRLGPFAPGASHELLAGASPVGRVVHRPNDPNAGLNHVDIVLLAGGEGGVWRLELAAGTFDVDFHAWIERDDKRGSQFVSQDAEPTGALNAIACGQRTIVVGAHVPVQPGAIWPSSSRGPTRDGRLKPELSAPGAEIRAAGVSMLSVVKSGTSMAAPHVAGLAALMMQAAAPNSLTADQVRQTMIDATRHSATGPWDAQAGYGRLDGVAVLKRLLNVP